jgi:hypothetical protein
MADSVGRRADELQPAQEVDLKERAKRKRRRERAAAAAAAGGADERPGDAREAHNFEGFG